MKMDNHLLNRVNVVKSALLKSHTIKVRNEWIEDCVNFFVNQMPNIDDTLLYQQAYEQFLLADLKNASNLVIPSMVLEKKKPFTLNGNFVLQINYLIDIAESPYEQWRRLRNIKLDEVAEIKESKTFSTRKKRVFKLELTDGHKTIYAMEYVLIASLNSKIAPGCKLQIIGPLQVVNHILLLEPRNLKVLGGDVDDLSIINAYENVLLRALNKPTTDTPVKDYNEEAPNESNQRVNNNVQPKPIQQVHQLPEAEESFLAGINFDHEDDVDIEMLNQIEEEDRMRRENLSNNQVRVTNQMPIEILDDDAFLTNKDFERIENLANQRENESIGIIEIPDVYRPRIIRTNDLLIPTIEIPDDEGNEQYLSELITTSAGDSIPKKIARIEPLQMSIADDYYKFKTQDGDNLVTVDQYISLSTVEKMKKNYVIWGCLDPMVKTLKVAKCLWSLKCEISDSYSHKKLELPLHNSVLEKMSGVTGVEMKLKRNEVQRQPQLKEDLYKIFENLARKLKAVEYFMKIEMKFQSNPQLIELLDDNRTNNETFSRKVQEENLQYLF